MSSTALLSAIDSTTHISPVAQQKKEGERTFLQKVREDVVIFGAGAGAIAGGTIGLIGIKILSWAGRPICEDIVDEALLASSLAGFGAIAGMSVAGIGALVGCTHPYIARKAASEEG